MVNSFIKKMVAKKHSFFAVLKDPDKALNLVVAIIIICVGLVAAIQIVLTMFG
jgi:hypothetical protein